MSTPPCRSARPAHRRRLAASALFALLALSAPRTPGRGQPDDDEPDDAPQAAPVQGVSNDENLNQWIFQSYNSGPVNPRERLDQMLALRVEDLDRVCKLTETQKRQVRLTGRGDVRQFFVVYDTLWKKYQLAKQDQQKMQEIWQDVRPLQSTILRGFFDDRSLLIKSLHHTLTAEQFALFEASERERLALRQRARVEEAVAMMEQYVPLPESQRRDVIARLTALTKPWDGSGPYAGYVVLMYQLSQLPEGKIKPMFDDFQWKAVSTLLKQFKGWKQWLKQAGQLPEEDDDVMN
jgi:hypothetical protein